jgi:hypothetical protein
MRTITLELPDTSADLANNLSKTDKDKLSTFVQFWLNSFFYGFFSSPCVDSTNSKRLTTV